jgi:putative PIN family toxin of toxin-antitoxin system
MILTLDTGILVRATSRSNGPARRLLGKIANNASDLLVLSPFILSEVGKVLAYSRMQQVLQITAEEIEEHVAYLRSVSRLVEPEVGMPVVLNDPNDDPVIYTAIGAGADVLCARDRDFYASNVIAFCQRYELAIMDEIQLLSKLDARP